MVTTDWFSFADNILAAIEGLIDHVGTPTGAQPMAHTDHPVRQKLAAAKQAVSDAKQSVAADQAQNDAKNDNSDVEPQKTI